MSKTLIVLNPHAAAGRAGKLWRQLEPLLWQRLGDLVVAITQHPREVARHIDQAYQSGLTRVVSIGGDGTNHTLVNALAGLNSRHPDAPPMVYGMLPVGTGRDWARTIKIPFKIEEAVEWIAHAVPRPTDIGQLTFDGQREYFLNISSAGISGEVARRVNAAPKRPWTFLQKTISALLTYTPPVMQIRLDGQDWYEGRAFILTVANGTTFAHGMKIAPNAQIDDGQFDIILVEHMSRPRILTALRMVYDGSHLRHPKVKAARAKQVQIRGVTGVLDMEFDGEMTRGRELTFEIRPGLLHLLAEAPPKSGP
ncbi:MAG: diacylglycerol kinase family lipid kinase [Chloroflexi bacterium]|nr:diacylglycerol kinase family lipid kinase [Chloroflexota bacterium]